ncbi:DUF4224 domain-containing protein [Cupriavidus necator]
MAQAAASIIRKTQQHWENTMILTNEQLIELTGGLRQGAARRRWIRKQLGIETPVKIDGHPIITWEQVNRGKSMDGKPRTGPRWSVAA